MESKAQRPNIIFSMFASYKNTEKGKVFHVVAEGITIKWQHLILFIYICDVQVYKED